MPRRPSSKHPRFSRSGGPTRRNERIRAREVRVIGQDEKQVGILRTEEALALAKSRGLDLVEVSPAARPPVCRILDYGRYKYERSKKEKGPKSLASKVKEIKLRVNIDSHDYLTKLRRAEAFLNKGSKLKITLMFRGREMQHPTLGFEVVKRMAEDLARQGKLDVQPAQSGRQIHALLSPLAEKLRGTLKFQGLDEVAPPSA